MSVAAADGDHPPYRFILLGREPEVVGTASQPDDTADRIDLRA
ncbi:MULTISPECIES: hypothetical protein [unclassified Streptomyces]|nr:hypothetical protein [Streptomyces sp. NBC_01429]